MWCSALTPLAAFTKILQTSGSRMGRDVVYSLLPRQSINLNKPLRIFTHSPTAAARSLQARTSEVLNSERLCPSALKFPSQLTGGGGRGESSSFTAEWFPHCKREVVSSPPPPYSHPYQLRRQAKPAWEMGPTCAAWRIAQPDC